MSTWYSKHVEDSNIIWRINNIQCITLVVLYANVNVTNNAKEDWYRVLQYQLVQADTTVGRLEGGLDQDAACHRFLFNLHSEHIPKEALEGFGDFKIGQVIRTVKYGDDIVLL